ncbi:hypothetical protein [Aestuariirhabdus sp. LZHN29]|uniref:hypothetical protein n=1 Tax=Aestuariirhabdus sp. LZHN29 TaxID=3417462 RepID=UPI003CF1A490
MTAWMVSVLGFSMALFCILPRRWSERWPLLLGTSLTVLLLVPVWQGNSLSDLLRGALGDFSITSLVLLSMASVSRLGVPSPLTDRQRVIGGLLVVAVAVPFYASTLGLTLVDPYRWGFGETLLLPVAALALLMVGLRCWWAVILLCSAVLLWSFGALLESRNLWDYLLDAMLVFYVLGAFLIGAVRQLMKLARSG